MYCTYNCCNVATLLLDHFCLWVEQLSESFLLLLQFPFDKNRMFSGDFEPGVGLKSMVWQQLTKSGIIDSSSCLIKLT